MPELPEIANLKRSLEPLLVGAVVGRVALNQPQIVRNIDQSPGPTRISGRRMLAGQTIRRLDRHGKELAIITRDGPSLCVHLGMSGQLFYWAWRRRLSRLNHVHCTWQITSPAVRGRLVFRDPRRFGGLWVFGSPSELRRSRWSRLGPDALLINPSTLAERLKRTRRPIKVVLLDQRVVAGIGNIYADEILFAARIHPLSRAAGLNPAQLRALGSAIPRVLTQALRAGGSTIRDYRDATGKPGRFASQHRAYGRAGLPCHCCGRPLESIRIAQRSTVFCGSCQRRRRATP